MSLSSGPSRRNFLAGGLTLPFAGCASPIAQMRSPDAKPDVVLDIGMHRQELAPGIVYPTFAYSDRVPGPVIRLREGKQALFEVRNNTPVPELAHWHGLDIPSDVDGAAEEGTPHVEPFSKRRYLFAPKPVGTQWYHTHAMGMKNLMAGAYTGMFGFFIVEGRDKGDYDQEVLVAMHHWGAKWVSGGTFRPDQPEHGLEVAYDYGTMNGRLMGHADPVRVKPGTRVLFRLLNASATENTWTALAGHKMRVVELDGHTVPNPREIDVLLLGPGERADVIVEMNNPGKWIFGAAIDAEREKGMGLVVEYAGATGAPNWTAVKRQWDVLQFGDNMPCAEPDDRIELVIGRIPGGPDGHNQWTLNGKTWPETPRIRVQKGKRYRLVYRNETDHGHPMHLHRHRFEIAQYGGKPAKGLFKDTINIRPNSVAELDFVANNPGPTLIHCHQAKHQDFGLMALMMYEGDVEPEMDHAAMQAAMARFYCGPPVPTAAAVNSQLRNKAKLGLSSRSSG
jgi:FtsP/CotA-like multicopper oxidase with cupredoxin domain